MPIYEYECETCGETTEILVVSSKPYATPKCEKCNRNMIQIISKSSWRSANPQSIKSKSKAKSN